jgi:hypothetical protein
LDEESGEVYQYLYRANSDAIESLNKIFRMEMRAEDESGISKIGGIGAMSRVGEVDAMSILFVLQLLWGKWEARDDVLHGIKITIPLIASTMHYQSTLQEMVTTLRESDIVIKMDEIESDDGVVMQITSRDICLLEQFALWYKPLATRSVISTKDFTTSLVSSLEDFVDVSLDIPSNYLIKIGTVQ